MIRTSKDKLQDIQGNNRSFCIFRCNRSEGGGGQIRYASAGLAELTGYSIADILHHKDPSFLHGPETDQMDVMIMNKAISSGEDIVLSLLNYKADGSKFWKKIQLCAVRNKSGLPISYIEFQSEISEQAAVELKVNSSSSSFVSSSETPPSLSYDPHYDDHQVNYYDFLVKEIFED